MKKKRKKEKQALAYSRQRLATKAGNNKTGQLATFNNIVSGDDLFVLSSFSRPDIDAMIAMSFFLSSVFHDIYWHESFGIRGGN